MNGWKTTPLGDLLDGGQVSYGVVQPGIDSTTGVPIVRVKDIRNGRIDTSAPIRVDKAISDRHRRTLLGGGELLLSLVGTVGEVAVAPRALDGWNVARAVAVIRSAVVSSYWLQLCFETQGVKSELQSLLNTTVQSTLNLSDLKRIGIPVPPKGVRDSIEEVLGALDDKIAANIGIAQLTDDILEAKYRYALVSRGAATRRLFEVIDVAFGEPFKGSEFSLPGQGRPLIRIRDLKTYRSQVWTTESREREVLIVAGDVVVGMDAEFRPTMWLGDDGLLNQRVCRMRGNAVGNAFVREALKAPLMGIENSKSATTVIHLNKSDLERVEIHIPEAERLRAFEAVAEPMYRHRISIAMESRTLVATRDALLPQLMSGKLRVRDAEKVLEGVL